MTKASIVLRVALLLGLAAMVGACDKQHKNQQAANATKSHGMEDMFPAPPAKPGWGQSIMDSLVNDLYGGSYEKALNAARTVASRLLQQEGTDNSALKLMDSALNQPRVGGPCERDGCIAHFDSNGEVVSAVTTSVLNFRKGDVALPKSLSEDELKEAAPALKKYRMQLHYSGNVVVVLSSSFRDAAMIAMLTQIEGTDFSVARQGKGACIVMSMDGHKVTLADDWIYSE
jgi:hypothetical protein